MRPGLIRTRGPLILAATLLAAATAQGQLLPADLAGPGEPAAADGRPQWVLGLGLADRPVYLGSDERELRALPLLSVQWANGWFAGTTGVGWRTELAPGLRVGLRLGFAPGRDAADAAALRGMGDIPSRAEVGAFANWRLGGPVSLSTELRHGSGLERDGLLWSVGLRTLVPVTAHHALALGLGGTWANAASLRSDFGVDAAQALSSGYSPYAPRRGLRDLNLSVNWAWRLTPDLSLRSGVKLTRLSSELSSSPLVRERTGADYSLLLSWRH